MRFERHYGGREALRLRGLAHFAEDCLMPEMDAIEIADGQSVGRSAAKVPGASSKGSGRNAAADEHDADGGCGGHRKGAG